MDHIEQRYVMKFLFLSEKRYKAIHHELAQVVDDGAVSLSTVKR
jgi:hypothetical protein